MLALQDHGDKPLEFGVNGIPWPLGINTATRREAFARTDLFDNRLGRKAGTLRNQAQREWHLRARAAGLRGFYIPEMVVHHVVEAERLQKQYFRRWYYWHGISRAILFTKLGVDMDSPDDSRLDFSKVPQIAGVPRLMYRTLARHAANLVRARLSGDSVAAFEHELWLCFFAGMAKQRWAERHVAIPSPQVNLSLPVPARAPRPSDAPLLLILTLSSGEAALPVLTRQLAEQSFQDFEHEVISGLPNLAAHKRLYRTVVDRAASFDLFMKLDADMTFRSETSLAEAVRASDEHPDAQHFEFRLWDCFTEEETLGVHMFRSGVSWGEITDNLFVDQAPNARHILWSGPPAPFVNHGEFVSDFECFAFGVHKFLKTAQRDRAGTRRIKTCVTCETVRGSAISIARVVRVAISSH